MIEKCKECLQIKKHEAFGLCRQCYIRGWSTKKRRSLGVHPKTLGLSNNHKKNIIEGRKRYYSKDINLSKTNAAGRQRAEKMFPCIFSCEICESTINLNRHHIDGNTSHNTRQNVAFLCSRCHNKAHFISIGKVRSKVLTLKQLKMEVIYGK